VGSRSMDQTLPDRYSGSSTKLPPGQLPPHVARRAVPYALWLPAAVHGGLRACCPAVVALPGAQADAGDRRPPDPHATGVADRMTAAFLQRRPAMPLIIAVAVLGGWAFGLLQETQDQGLVYWWSFVVLAMALGAAACLLPVGRDPRFVLALRAVPPLIAAVLALAL